MPNVAETLDAVLAGYLLGNHRREEYKETLICRALGHTALAHKKARQELAMLVFTAHQIGDKHKKRADEAERMCQDDWDGVCRLTEEDFQGTDYETSRALIERIVEVRKEVARHKETMEMLGG